jgi:hypothetical protein
MVRRVNEIATTATNMDTKQLTALSRRRSKEKKKQEPMQWIARMMRLLTFEPDDLEDYEDQEDYEIDYVFQEYVKDDQEDKVTTFEIMEGVDIKEDYVEVDNDWNLGDPYVKRWAKYNPEGSFKYWRVRLVQDLLPCEEMVEEVSLVTTEDCEDDNEEILPISEMKACLTKVAEAKKLKPINVESLVNAVKFKFVEIGIDSVS